MIVYRHADPRFLFLWESAAQPSARWHGLDDEPVQYFADTPDGAWAEFLRREGITASGCCGAERDGTVLAVFGSGQDFVGWVAGFAARPRSDLLRCVRHL
jgi:hypothetical protein